MDGAAEDEIQQDQHDSCDQHDHENRDGVGLYIGFAGPYDLFQLAFSILKILADAFEKVLDLAKKRSFLGLVALSLGCGVNRFFVCHL